MPVIRPPDPSIKDRTLMYGPYSSAEATRRYIHLAFRDAHTAIDLTAAHGGFWKPPVPPGLAVTTNNLDPASNADLHLDFTDTHLPDDAYDLVVYDPPHLADLGAESIMGQRFGSAQGTEGLDRLVTAGALEAWRIARIGMLVKLADHSHGGEFLQLSRWVMDRLGIAPYFVAHTTRAPLLDGKWEVQRVPRSNGAVYIVWRKGSQQHRDFDGLYERQEARNVRQVESEMARTRQPNHCASCLTLMPPGAPTYAVTCSASCRNRLYRERKRGAPRWTYSKRKDGDGGQQATDRERFAAVGTAGSGAGVRDQGAAEVLAGGLRRWLHRGPDLSDVVEQFQGREAGVAV